MFFHAQEVGRTFNTHQVTGTPLGPFAHGLATPLRSGRCVRYTNLAAVLANLTIAQHNVTTSHSLRIIVIPVGPPRSTALLSTLPRALQPCFPASSFRIRREHGEAQRSQ